MSRERLLALVGAIAFSFTARAGAAPALEILDERAGSIELVCEKADCQPTVRILSLSQNPFTVQTALSSLAKDGGTPIPATLKPPTTTIQPGQETSLSVVANL